MNLHEAISLYRLQLEANGRSEHTLAQADRHLRRFREWLGDGDEPGADRDIETIDATLVARFFVSDAARLGANGAMKKPSSINAMRSSLRAFFRFLHDAGLVRSDPTRLVRRARCTSQPPRGLSGDEESKLLGAVDSAADATEKRDRAILRLMLSTGTRIGSVLALDVGDLDSGSNEVTLRTMKGGGTDRLPVPPDVMENLIGIVAGRAAGPLFVSRSGARLGRRHFDRRLKFWGLRAGVAASLHAHRLRHTVGQRLFDASGCVLTVASVLRHASLASSARYARVGPERLKRVIGETWAAVCSVAR